MVQPRNDGLTLLLKSSFDTGFFFFLTIATESIDNGASVPSFFIVRLCSFCSTELNFIPNYEKLLLNIHANVTYFFLR